MDTLLKEFLDDKSLSLSNRTVESYTYYLTRFSNFISKPLVDVKKEDITAFIRSHQDRGNKKSSLSTIQTCIISFYSWARDNDKIQSNPLKGLNRIKTDKCLPVYLTKDEIKTLFDTAIDERDNLIVKLLYTTGIRVSELVNMKKSDIDFKTGRIKIFGKGSKERMVIIRSPFVLDQLYRYSKDFAPDQRIISLDTATVQQTLRKLRAQAGFTKKVTPHKLRHSFATHLKQDGGSIVDIQKLLGHSNLNTTQIYAHSSMEDQEKMIDNSSISKVI